MTRRSSIAPTFARVPAFARRGFLAGCGALPVLAGIFDARRRAFAAAGPAPRRLLIYAHLEGSLRTSLVPTGADTSFTLAPATKPLEPWKNRLLILDGINNTAGEKNLLGDTHEKAHSGLLTGITPKERISPPLRSPGESLDQLLGPKIRGPARLSSAELTVEVDTGTGSGLVYPIGGGTTLPMIGKASLAFDRLFGGIVGPGSTAVNEAEARRMRVLRGSVLDYVARDLTALRPRLASADGKKLQAHLDAIRDLEKQVTATTTSASCNGLSKPTDFNVRDKTLIPAAGRLAMDMIVQAFACDVTRMITFYPTNAGIAGAPWLGEARDVHLISHGKYGDWNDMGPKFMRWAYEQHAYLMQKLAEVPEGDGTLLDHTLILSIHDFGDSASHNFKNLLIMLIGDAGGYLKTGRFLTFRAKPHNNVLVTVANAMGVDLKTFGEPTLCDGGPMPELRA